MMKASTRERDVETYFKKRVEDIGVRCLKFIPDDCIGMPDRLLLLRGGRVMWVELKKDDGKVSAIQRYRHHELRDIGHTIRVVWNKHDVDKLIDEIKKTEEA